MTDPHATGHGSGRTPRPPGLRLVRGESSPEVAARHSKAQREKLARQVTAENRQAATLSNSDARRIMAQTVAENLEGGRAGILIPERRRALISAAQRLGMRQFDANLIIAIVQDRFRRGLIGASGAGHDERLAMIEPTSLPHPSLADHRRARFWSSVRVLLASLAIGGILAVWMVNWLTGQLP